MLEGRDELRGAAVMMQQMLKIANSLLLSDNDALRRWQNIRMYQIVQIVPLLTPTCKLSPLHLFGFPSVVIDAIHEVGLGITDEIPILWRQGQSRLHSIKYPWYMWLGIYCIIGDDVLTFLHRIMAIWHHPDKLRVKR